MRYLLDTCVISEISRDSGDACVRNRVAAIPSAELFLSVITIGEIAMGVALLDPGRKKTKYETFLQVLERDYGDRILDVDAETSRIWGESAARSRRRGRTIGASEGLIAASALRHGLMLMTRDVRDFAETGARIINPVGRGLTRFESSAQSTAKSEAVKRKAARGPLATRPDSIPMLNTT